MPRIRSSKASPPEAFSNQIREILQSTFRKSADDVFDKSQLLQYIEIKTRSANRGSKSRSSYANLYALYVVIEDYLAKSFDRKKTYSSNYAGAQFSDLMRRQRELPFGSKLQNHALNHRLNEEFKKYFPTSKIVPLIRNLETQRYWINEGLLKVKVGKQSFNLAKVILKIIDSYIEKKRDSFQRFIQTCNELGKLELEDTQSAVKFITELLEPNVDARLFEIVSYAILKYYYHDEKIYWGFSLDSIKAESLKLYKTGRTNANDGGIDFVMRPLGRFFQVTETTDVTKFFLDIDKIERFPITFVIKSEQTADELKEKLRRQAMLRYNVASIVSKYMECIEEIINLPTIRQRFQSAIKQGYLHLILEEIVKQSRVEFNDEGISD
jgi:hypothetical protein